MRVRESSNHLQFLHRWITSFFVSHCYVFKDMNSHSACREPGRANELTWESRSQLLAREFSMIDADIFCLQEVQYNHYDEFYKPVFEAGKLFMWIFHEVLWIIRLHFFSSLCFASESVGKDHVAPKKCYKLPVFTPEIVNNGKSKWQTVLICVG